MIPPTLHATEAANMSLPSRTGKLRNDLSGLVSTSGKLDQATGLNAAHLQSHR